MSSHGLEDTGPQGATWPDVGLAIVSFAREDTTVFVVAVIAISVFAIAIGVALWLAFLGFRQRLQNDYLRRLVLEIRRLAQNGSPGGESDD